MGILLSKEFYQGYTYVKDILKKLGRPIPDRVKIKHLRKLVLSGRGEKKVIKLEL